LTQHMQLTVSSTLSAEHRQQLSHSHTAGRDLGVPQAAQRHRPHLTQMMDSVPGELPSGLPDIPPPVTGDGFSDWSVFGQVDKGDTGERVGWVITVELVGRHGETDWVLITVLLLLFTALGKEAQGRVWVGGAPGPPGTLPGPLKGVST